MNYLLKIIISLSSAVFVFHSLTAQNTSVGLKVGANNATIAELGGASSRLGFRGGAFLTYSITREFGVTGEINYAIKGANTGGDQTIALNYVEVPILAQYFFVNKGPFRPKVIAGPYGALLLNATRGGSETNQYGDRDFGAVLGLGFHQRIGKKRWLNVDVRYSYGLADIRENTTQANRGLSLNAGISFPIELD